MTRTDFLTAAYHVCMDTLLLVFLLMTLSQNKESLQKLRSALCFYRENRELIQTIAGSMGAAGTAQPQSEREPARGETKESRPRGDDSLKVFEEYLKRCAV